MDRREFILGGVWVGAVAVAGCSGGGDDGTTTDESSPTTDGDTTTDDRGETTTNGETTTDDNGETTTTEERPEVVFGNLYATETNYVAEVEVDDPGVTMEVRYYGENWYQRYEDAEGNIIELYRVDGDDYAVIDGERCFRNPGASLTPDSDVDSDAETYGSKPDVDLEPSGTDEIDGETVYVFEVTGPDVEGELTFYVSASTGYLRRIEAEWGVIVFHSWGDVEPITRPDMECQDFSS
ncbi:Uncharacterized protein HSBGL_1670 [Halapricum desulfuricans]|uniref:Uncharacterized protein n=1 Tax=Halapricum desulfuricans TaxID=2841257 RepID=A0A897NPH4_9EURY|nr:hypothetical protein [Halapricum desulfuricans]QSG12086.1 Uncharacterized protein HSBGL_1670 [Halapricum desulfuricans]